MNGKPRTEGPAFARTAPVDTGPFDHVRGRIGAPHLWKYENGTWALRRAVWNIEV